MLPVRTAGSFWRQTCTTRQVGTQLVVVQQAVQSSLLEFRARAVTDVEAYNTSGSEPEDDD
ncbi:hypothetical protein T4E_977 [Trichinella pseudospiralis]|uniref:Uncharacterized protein n=1 Tax=Trichinella pseudospiralis TaxID=6337 RepID=A0A0V0YIL1_TRIPS|nr:hypothetical protein T4E_977 [Trichinella pseudospiralis]